MNTMQIGAPLRRLPLNSGQEPIGQIIDLPLVLDPPYQRGSVWGTRRRQRLIFSLLAGIPVGSIWLNVRPDTQMTTAVVDGKQRIETITGFLADEFAIPASWLPTDAIAITEDTADGPYVRYSGLTDRGRARLRRCSVTTQRTDLATVAEEADLFDLINFGGLAQGETDQD